MRKPSRQSAADTTTAAEVEQPSTGGSYIRHEDGRLERVEFTAQDAAIAAEEDADVTLPNSDAGQEG